MSLAPLARPLAGLLGSPVSFSERPRDPANGRGMAIAGLVLGIVALAVWIPALVAIGIAQS